MTTAQEVISKLYNFIHQEKDEDNPSLEITLEEAKILLNLTY